MPASPDNPLWPAFAARTGWDLRENDWAAAVRARGGAAWDLTVTNPTAVGLAYPRERILAALASPQALAYHPTARGAVPARAAVADYYAARGAAVSSGQILLTTGTSEAYAHLFRLLANPGDRLHVPSPSYPLLDHLAAIHDLDLVPYPLWHAGAWQLDAAELERTLTPRSRAVVVIHPNNPTGSYLSAEEWALLLALAARHGLAIIADEVFFEYPWDPTSVPLDLATAVPEAGPPVFLLSGLSKLSALPQMKLGWLAALGAAGAANWRQQALARLEVVADAYLSVGAPVQAAAAELLAVRQVTQPQVLARVRANLATLDAALAGQSWVSRLSAAGGWMAVLRLPAWRSGEAWAEVLLAAGVLAHPGEFYGFAGGLSAGAHLVVSLLTPEAQWAEGIGRLLACVVRAGG
ncbi:MAG: pyridoxal phosphate-dependent aminotransferase [Terriglobales bacterium]